MKTTAPTPFSAALSRASSNSARPPHVLITQKTSSGPSTKPNSAPPSTPTPSHHRQHSNNPTGKVFSRAELELIRDLCLQHNVLAITDEIYEHIIFDNTKHISMMELDGMRDRTIVHQRHVETYSVTGWRVGWAVAPPFITDAIRKVHDFLTVGAQPRYKKPEPPPSASLPPITTISKLANLARRDHLIPILEQAGFRCFRPRGAYYVMTDISVFGFPNDRAFAHHLVKEIASPASPFEMMGEGAVVGEAEDADVGHDVIGAAGAKAAEAGLFQDWYEMVAAG